MMIIDDDQQTLTAPTTADRMVYHDDDSICYRHSLIDIFIALTLFSHSITNTGSHHLIIMPTGVNEGFVMKGPLDAAVVEVPMPPSPAPNGMSVMLVMCL